MESEDTKRRYDRLRFSFIAKFRIYEKDNPSLSGRWDIVTIRDISAGGLSFNYHDTIPVDTIIELKMGFSLPVGEINCLSKVQRVDHKPVSKEMPRRSSLCGIAVRFIDIDSEHQKAIDKLVEVFNENLKQKKK